MTQIEKIARLIGRDLEKVTDKHPQLGLFFDEGPEFRGWFNPLTNKDDLMDVECALGISIDWFEKVIMAGVLESGLATEVLIADHPDKFTARAAAVCAVAEQIYDRGQV